METSSFRKKIIEKYGNTIDLRKNPEILDQIVNEVKEIYQADLTNFNRVTSPSPFGVSWMDSWAAHWVINPPDSPDRSMKKEFESVVKGLVDLKFKDRLSEIKRFIGIPNGGSPEPGTPEPPEPGTPQPGLGPIFAPPDGGTPPEPGRGPGPGPSGIEPGLAEDNPWILYWFVSMKAPLILEMIDAHFTRRINELAEQRVAK